jgi:hypothetical protein
MRNDYHERSQLAKFCDKQDVKRIHPTKSLRCLSHKKTLKETISHQESQTPLFALNSRV